MKFPFFVIIAILLLFSSCKKKEPDAPYSYWYVNNDSFSTNNVGKTVDQMRGMIDFGGGDYAANTFYMDFGVYGEFPESGSYPVKSTNFPLKIFFYHDYISYTPSIYNNTFLTASKTNGQVHYILPATWFYKYQSPSDSILIKGNFTLP